MGSLRKLYIFLGGVAVFGKKKKELALASSFLILIINLNNILFL